MVELAAIARHPENPALRVIPRGLLRSTSELLPGGHAEWMRLAPLLEAALSGSPRGASREDVRRLSALAEAARASGVLTLVDAADVAKLAVGELARREGAAGCLEVRNVKEGHTSTVWRAAVETRWGVRLFCVNVSRDADAADELAASSVELRRLHKADPEFVANVAEVARLPIRTRAGVATEAVVTVSDWIDEAMELHVVPDGDHGRFAVIESFAVVDGRQTARVRMLESEASDAVWRRLWTWRARHSRMEEGGVVCPEIEVNEGDVVWDGENPRIVACSTPGGPQTVADWARSMLSPTVRMGSGPDAALLAWGRPAAALAALAEGVEGHPSLSLNVCLTAAAGRRAG